MQLRLEPHTGRSHQLRVHLAWLGHPILGDPLDGPARSRGAAHAAARICPAARAGAWGSSALTQEFLPGGGWPARAPGGVARQGTGGSHWGGSRPLTGAGLVGPEARPTEGVGPGLGDGWGWCCHARFGHADAADALFGGCGCPRTPDDLPAARGWLPEPDGVGGWGDGRSRVARGWLRPC